MVMPSFAYPRMRFLWATIITSITTIMSILMTTNIPLLISMRTLRETKKGTDMAMSTHTTITNIMHTEITSTARIITNMFMSIGKKPDLWDAAWANYFQKYVMLMLLSKSEHSTPN